MTRKTVGFMNGEVGSLHELGMAGRTAKSHLASQFTEMSSMGKVHVLKNHVSLQVLFLVTPFLQATPVIYFIVRLPDSFPYHQVSHRELKIYPFPLEMVQETWLAMTVEATDVIVGGVLPGIDIFFHVVT
jgi:hypothetical protein